MTPRSPSSNGSSRAMSAAARRITLNVPIRLTSMTRRNPSSGIAPPSRSTIRPGVPMPAQLTAMRAGPCWDRAAATAASVAAASLTSQRKAAPPIAAAASLAAASLASRKRQYDLPSASKGYTVFNAEQCDGLPVHYYAKAEPPALTDLHRRRPCAARRRLSPCAATASGRGECRPRRSSSCTHCQREDGDMSETVRDVYSRITAKICADLEQGHGQSRQPPRPCIIRFSRHAPLFKKAVGFFRQGQLRYRG